MGKRSILLILAVVALISLCAPSILAEDKADTAETLSDDANGLPGPETELVTLANEYIRIVVNGEGENTGRFALETIGGDPDRNTDDGQPLIYGRPKPWTSYTTIKIDGTDYVFGGPTTKRAGLAGKYGEVTIPPLVQGDGIDVLGRLGPLEVQQRLEFAVSSTTGYKDSARIIYRVTNVDTVPHQVGLRITLDTLLGANDGAPFRFHEEAILGDARYGGEALPEFWQAFDSLSDPRVIAQGTLAGPDVTRPDRLLFSNWGSFADGLWDVDFQPGREFLRLGEFELDSAVGLYWDPQTLEPGETKTFVTAYGMGGLSISPGELSLGMTSPAKVALGKDGRVRIPVVAYLENTGEGIGRDLTITVKVPSGMSFGAGTASSRKIGFLRPGRSSQVSWDLIADQRLAGRVVSLRVEVNGPDLSQPIAVERKLQILGPPQMAYDVQVEKKPDDSGYFLVKANLKNQGQSSAYNVEATLKLPEGWEAAPLERLSRFLGEIEAPPETGSTVSWKWQVKPLAGSGQEALTGVLSSTNSEPIETTTREIEYELTGPGLVLEPESPRYQPGQLINFQVQATNIRGFNGTKLILRYDTGKLAYLGSSRGHLWVDESGQPQQFRIDHVPERGEIVIQGQYADKRSIFTGSGNLATLRFLALKSGEAKVVLGEAPIIISSVADQNIGLQVRPVIIEE